MKENKRIAFFKEFDIDSIEDENSKNTIKSFVDAVKNDKLDEYYIKRFYHKRDDYLDGLPKEDVRNLSDIDEKGMFTHENYKCKGNYIWTLIAALDGAIEYDVIEDDVLKQKIEEFSSHKFNYYEGKFTSKEEIDMINNILNDAITYLETKIKNKKGAE